MKWIIFIITTLLFAGCSTDKSKPPTLTLATTTSTRDSGLLDVLILRFESQTGITVKLVAVGSGQALELGRRGDADVLLTHAPDAEERFMKEGHGQSRQGVMHNDFVLVGPPNDPAHIEGQDSISNAFNQISQRGFEFISRGDESGTHMKERLIWEQARLVPSGDWYVEAGSGMAETLRMASEKRAYTLADRGTFLAQEARLDLTILFEGDPILQNPYSVIVVSSEKHPDVNSDAAETFAEFLLSEKTQKLIEDFGVDNFGQPLFFPRAATAKSPK